ncbi:MAG: ATP synthase F1 subunit epsilon [Pirellulaceae bacterium]|nr:ATP synthase F1 subunit epsilon [Pirellulaceae bacterium]
MAQLNCIVVTPEETALEAKAEFVALPLFDGEIGIARGHSPMIGRLGYGEMRLRTGDKVTRYYLDGGFVQVVDDVVSVLTNRAVPAAHVDASAAQRQLDDARQQTATTDDLLEKRDRLVAQARAQLRTARRGS